MATAMIFVMDADGTIWLNDATFKRKAFPARASDDELTDRESLEELRLLPLWLSPPVPHL